MFKLKMYMLFIIGVAIGGAIGLFAYNMLFEREFSNLQRNIETDWDKVITNMNMTTDQVINLKKLLIQDKVKFGIKKFDDVISLRAEILGTDKWEERTKLLDQIEDAMNGVIDFYNNRMDLRAKRFYYVEWGMLTDKYKEQYNEAKNEYIDEVHEYNVKLKMLPYSLIAKREKLAEIPQPEESRITTVQVATE